MTNAQVVCVSSRIPTEPYYRLGEFLESLRRFGEVPVNLGEGQPWRGLMTKPYLLREWLRAGGNTSDRLIVADAWDIVFSKHPHGLGDRCRERWGDAIVFNAEKGLFPRGDLEAAFPDPSTPWRYLNSGWFCGPADAILAMLEAMPIEEIGFDPPGGPYPNDQGEYQALWAKQHEPLSIFGNPVVDADTGGPVCPNDAADWKMVMDTDCHVVQTCSACEPEEFDFTGEHIRNLATGTEPGVWHFNGGSKQTIMPLVLAKLALP